MSSYFQTVGALILIGSIVLAPLLIGLMIALARASARRAAIAVAIAGAALVFAGVALADALTGLRSQIAYYRDYATPPTLQGALVLALASLLLSAGLSLSFAAVILGLRETARARRWGWFSAFLLTQLAAGVGTTLFYVSYEQFSIAEPLTRRLYAGDPGVSVPYYLLTSLLLVAVPLAVLLCALLGIPRGANAEPTPPPIPPRPPTPPSQPYP